MPETLSPGEVARTLSHHHGKTAGEKHAERIEIIEAILLAIVAVATAWSGYQTARWDGRQAHLYALSAKERAAENRAATLSGQQRLYDTTTFGFWLQEKVQGHNEEAAPRSSGASGPSTALRSTPGSDRSTPQPRTPRPGRS